MILHPLIKIGFFASFSFFLALILTPFLTHFLYKYKLTKKIRALKDTPFYTKFHKKKEGTPTMGGVLIWGISGFLILFFGLIYKIFPNDVTKYFNFLSRSQTYLPIGALIASAIVGLFDDFLDIKKLGKNGLGLRFRYKILIYSFIGFLGGLWFYSKLGWDSIHIPFNGDVYVGFFYVLFFMIVVIATAFSVNEADGLDGLAGGMLLPILGVYLGITYIQGRYDIATLIAVIIGSLLAFLWFNIPPARFFMGDTGSMGLGTFLAVIAMLTDTALILPIIAFPLVLEAFSVILQFTFKKILKKKMFYSTPIHHHFEVLGWPEYKIVMRFWVISFVFATIGLILVLVDKVLR